MLNYFIECKDYVFYDKIFILGRNKKKNMFTINLK